MLRKYKMSDAKAVSTPINAMSNNQEDKEKSSEDEKQRFPYRESTKNQRTKKTRPDMTYAVSYAVSRTSLMTW